MPSSHRRVGLVLDEGMRSAFAVLRQDAGPTLPEAGLARKAIFEGAAFSAIVRHANTPSASQATAQQLLRDLRLLLDTLALPRSVQERVIEEIDRADRSSGLQERRRRQLALLESENVHGRAAAESTESIDELDHPLP